MAQKINVDSTPAVFQPVLYFHQNDVGRQFQIEIVSKDGYVIPSGAAVKIEATKPSGLGFSVTGSLSGNVISFASTATMTDESGRFPAQVKITSGPSVIYAANFLMVGEPNIHPDGTTDGTGPELISQITLLVERAEAAADTAAEDAAAAAQARVDEMLDYLPQEVSDLKSDIAKVINESNLLLTGKYVEGAYYSAGHYDNSTYNYFIVNVTNGENYIIPKGLRFLSKENAQIYSHPNKANPYTYTADYTGKLYVTFYADTVDCYMYLENADVETMGSFQKPSLNENIMLQELGYSKKYAVSQDAITKGLHPVQTLADERNLLQKCAIHEEAYYYSGVEHPSSAYDYFAVPVINGETYMISAGCRFLAKKTSDIESHANYLPMKYTADFTGDLYVSFSRNGYGYFVTKASDFFTMVGSYQQNNLKDVAKHYSKGYASVSADSMSDGDTLYLPFTNLKKNNRYYFSARVSSFSEIRIGHGQGTYASSWLRITASQIISNYYFTEVVSRYIDHGLTIANDIAVEVVVNNDNTAKVTLWSNGESFTATVSKWFGEGDSDYFVSTTTATLMNCSFTWSSGDFVKKTWLFGDSYTAIGDPSRWCYYLHNNDDIDNILISGYGGESSNRGIVALKSAINNYGCPDIIIWAYGMNDGTDTSSDSSAAWQNGILEMMKICTSKGITPILCTIPTVPTINHEQKNSWIRASGYRYIDFAKAVGASPSGAWYSGMLSSDNVHPTVLGAKALYMQAMVDCPELTF